MADAILGYGSLVQVNNGAGFVTIGKVTDIGTFGAASDDVETTAHDSGASGYKTFTKGLKDPGELTFSGNWVADTNQTQLLTDANQGPFVDTDKPFRVVLPAGRGTWAFTGYVKNFVLNPQRGGVLTFDASLRSRGEPSFTLTTSAGWTTPFVVVTPNAGAAATYIPALSQAVTEYVVTVGTTATSVTVTVTAAAGVITVNGTVVASGVASPSIALGAAGSVTTVVVNVTETGLTTKQYILRIQRP